MSKTRKRPTVLQRKARKENWALWQLAGMIPVLRTMAARTEISELKAPCETTAMMLEMIAQRIKVRQLARRKQKR